MAELVIGTQNPAKLARYTKLLAQIKDLRILSLADIDLHIKADEPYNTAIENARHKAHVYAKHTDKAVLAIDEALYLDIFKGKKQIGVHVRRFFDKKSDFSDEKLYKFWKKELKKVSKVTGYWEYAFCVCIQQSRQTECICQSPLVFLDSNVKYIEGYPLSSFCHDPEKLRPFASLTEDERFEIDSKKLHNLVEKMREFFKIEDFKSVD